MERVLSIVWIAIRVIFKTCPEQNHARYVLKTPLPTSVGFPLVILVVVAPKQKKAVQSVPVATRVNLALVPAARVNNARRVNRVRPMMIRPILVRLVTRGIIKMISAKLPAYPVFRASIKT